MLKYEQQANCSCWPGFMIEPSKALDCWIERCCMKILGKGGREAVEWGRVTELETEKEERNGWTVTKEDSWTPSVAVHAVV